MPVFTVTQTGPGNWTYTDATGAAIEAQTLVLTQIKNIAEQALSDATKTSAIVATAFLIFGLIATFRIHKSRTD